MPHRMALDGVKAGCRKHVLLPLPGGMDSPPDHLAILIVHPGPEAWLTKFFQNIRIGKVQVQEHPRPFERTVTGLEEGRADLDGDFVKNAGDEDPVKCVCIGHLLGRNALDVYASLKTALMDQAP